MSSRGSDLVHVNFNLKHFNLVLSHFAYNKEYATLARTEIQTLFPEGNFFFRQDQNYSLFFRIPGIPGWAGYPGISIDYSKNIKELILFPYCFGKIVLYTNFIYF